MKSIMIDSNVVIKLLKDEGRTQKALKEFTQYKFVISHLVYAEVMCGAQISRKAQTRKFLKRFELKPYSVEAQKQAHTFLYKYFTGRENKPMDLLIAAHAKQAKLPLITLNAKDFIFNEVDTYDLQKQMWIHKTNSK